MDTYNKTNMFNDEVAVTKDEYSKQIYRTEQFSGSGVRDLKELLTFEIYELGNADFLSYAFEHFELDEPLKERIVTMIEYLEGIHMDISGKFHDEANQVVDLILDQIRKYTGINIRYGLWLTSVDAIKSIYSFSISDSMEVYRYEPGLIISDVGFDGKLYAYEELPKPLELIEIRCYKL